MSFRFFRRMGRMGSTRQGHSYIRGSAADPVPPGFPVIDIDFANLDGSDNSTLTPGGNAPLNIVNLGSWGGTFVRQAGTGVYNATPYPHIVFNGVCYWKWTGSQSFTPPYLVGSLGYRANGNVLYYSGVRHIGGELNLAFNVSAANQWGAFDLAAFSNAPQSLNIWDSLTVRIGGGTVARVDISGSGNTGAAGGIIGGTATEAVLGAHAQGVVPWVGGIGGRYLVYEDPIVDFDDVVTYFTDAFGSFPTAV